MRSHAALMLAMLTAAAQLGRAQPDPDSDGDGLSDFHEVHKHSTDPAKPDSDADGVPDGDWLERREFTYTVRAVMHVMKPINPGTLTDDYQDGRVLDDHEDYAEIEVILYPVNTVAEAIVGDHQWGSPDAAVARYLVPGATTNWDESMRADLRAELAAEGVDLDVLTDAEAAARVSHHLMSRVNSEDSFTTFAAEFDDRGHLVIPDDMRDHWANELATRGRTLGEQLDHELYGRGMFRTRTIGSCTSAAIYLATGLKAAGLPARTIICIPITDGNDDAELALAQRLTNHKVREIVTRAHRRSKNTWTSHTFNEVHVGGRWVRLNYSRLGQDILDEEFLGLMVHVNTFRDHADARLSAWGRHDDGAGTVCGYANPYSCISLSDRFGPHCTLDNPPLAPRLPCLTINRVYWYDLQPDPPRVQMDIDDAETAGHLVAVVEEEAGSDDYGDFYAEVGKLFLLSHPEHPQVRAFATRGYWIDSRIGLRDFYLQIPPEDYPLLVPGVEYRLLPQAAENGREWRVSDDVRVVRPLQ
ncbi:MAG TPA: transglutaminase domain-containing protein [Phycisphaerales bacterium]|nr:transglutaminase domain-containing protein [Phycisphaerales bacterium]